MSRSPLPSRPEIEELLRTVPTKRQFDELVAAFRRPGAVASEDRDALDDIAQKLIQRFAAAGTTAKVAVGRKFSQKFVNTGGRR